MPVGFPLFQEGLDALLALVACPPLGDSIGCLTQDMRINGSPGNGRNQIFRIGHGARRILHNLIQQLISGLRQMMHIVHQLMQQTKAMRRFTVKHLRCLEIAAAGTRAHRFHHIGGDDGRDETELHFR